MLRTGSKVVCSQCRKPTAPDPKNTKRCFSCGALYALVTTEPPKSGVRKSSRHPAKKR
jgi:hypothetical protein